MTAFLIRRKGKTEFEDLSSVPGMDIEERGLQTDVPSAKLYLFTSEAINKGDIIKRKDVEYTAFLNQNNIENLLGFKRYLLQIRNQINADS